MAPFTADDLHRHRRVLEVHASPSHEPVVFVVRSVDRGSDGYTSHLWRQADGDGQPRQLTFGSARDQAPRLGPDGRRLAFLSDRDGTARPHLRADPTYVGGRSTFDREKARQLSPLQSIEKSRTPTLFLQGKEDERCPKCQSEELFVSMMRAGDTPAELVLYPGEDHHFLGQGAPSVRQDAAERIVQWLERFAGAPSGDAMLRSESAPETEQIK